MEGCHVSSDQNSGVDYIFAFHTDVLSTLENDALGDLVLLLRKEVELCLVIFRKWFHF